MRKLVLVGIAACGYRPGSFVDFGRIPFPGVTRTIGCLDVGVAATADAQAQGPVVAYSFGNRCRRVVTLDLATVRAVGRDANGDEHVLAAYDPRGELAARPIEALWVGRENIEYVAPATAPPIVSVCVDIGGLDATTVERVERWVCTHARTTACAKQVFTRDLYAGA